MPTPVFPDPRFRDLSEAEVTAALADPHENPVAAEVARLVIAYTENFTAHVARLGYVPTDILHVTPRTAIEAVAMQITTQTIREQLAANAMP